MADPLRVEVEPWGPDPDRAMEIARAALERPAVKAELDGAEARLLSVAPVDTEDPAAPPERVRATVYDYDAERTLLVDVPLDGAGEPDVSSTVKQPLPVLTEREAAVAILEDHPELGPAVRDGRLIPYRSMPPLVSEELPDGTVERTLTVGLLPAEGRGEAAPGEASADDEADGRGRKAEGRGRGEAGHEIVGVRLGRREVVRFDGGAPPTARASSRRCGLPDARQQTTTERPGAARVTIRKGTETLWKLIAVRPAASSGRDGSGVELRDVSYKGRRVLRRAHVPILNVRYDGDACGPFRDWQNEESRFKVEDATAPAPGFRLCKKATTILDTDQDHGNVAGVAIFVDGQEVELVSELEAGWYRYISRWRLHADGRIRARFGFGAVSNSCVCAVHHHHAYWRFDFDIGGAADDAVLEFNDPKLPGQDDNWHTLKHEIRRRRNQARKRRWRVRNRGSGEGYILIPGQNDGEADSYGVGDFWALRHRPGQIDDGAVADDTRAHLNRFVNGESLVGTNVVVWYAGHFSHDVAHDHSSGGGHIVGPTLVPDRW